jgi:hypothetical protein
MSNAKNYFVRRVEILRLRFVNTSVKAFPGIKDPAFAGPFVFNTVDLTGSLIIKKHYTYV